MVVERHTNVKHTIDEKPQTELAQPLSPLTHKKALVKKGGGFGRKIKASEAAKVR